jgi:hypothetical protein
MRCGDGVRDPGEVCDNGVNDGSYDGCAADCTRGPFCGDGVAQPPEACDDGAANAMSPGTCRPSCELPGCRDGIVDPGEICLGRTFVIPELVEIARTAPGLYDDIITWPEDRDGDGDSDLILWVRDVYGAGRLSVWLRRAAGMEEIWRLEVDGTSHALISDRDGREWLDLLVAGSSTATVWTATPDGGFEAVEAFPTLGLPKTWTYASLVDLDGDGERELTVWSRDRWAALTRRTVGFRRGSLFETPTGSITPLPDLDGDGLAELLEHGQVEEAGETQYTIAIRSGLGGAMFGPSVEALRTDARILTLLPASIDGTAPRDCVALLGGGGHVHSFVNTGGRLEEVGDPIPRAGSFPSIDVHDFDRDGIDELVCCNCEGGPAVRSLPGGGIVASLPCSKDDLSAWIEDDALHLLTQFERTAYPLLPGLAWGAPAVTTFDGVIRHSIAQLDGDGLPDYFQTWNLPSVRHGRDDRYVRDAGRDLAIVGFDDLNGDGSVDLVADFGWIANFGTDGFEVRPSMRRTWASGDVDRDGRPDRVVDDRGDIAVESGRTVIGTATITGLVIHAAVADVTGDGASEVVVVARNGENASVTSFEWRGAGLARLGTTVLGPVALPPAIALADVDADRRADLIVVDRIGSEVRIHRSTPTGFVPYSTLATAEPMGIAAADLDADGDVDLAIGRHAPELEIRWNDAGAFARGPTVSLLGGDVRPAAADLDGDGRIDLAARSLDAPEPPVDDRFPSRGPLPIATVLRNDGGTFTALRSFYLRGTPEDVHARDVTGDGVIDLVTSGRRVVVYEGHP